jgi:ADP-heptose:LPS heptosyltransferase
MSGRIVKDFLWSVYSLLVHLLDAVFLLFVQGRPAQGTPFRKVLVIRLDAIGDFVLWLDAAREIRRLYPPDRFRITLLGNRLWTPLAEKLPWFDEVLPVERKRFKFDPAYRRRVLLALRDSGFDVAVQPTFSREFLYGDSVIRFSGARERIGSTGDCSNQVPFLKRISDRWYTRLIPASKEPLMELERNAEYLRGLGIHDFRANVPELPGYAPLQQAPGHRDRYVLFPGVGVPNKQWPPENFARLAERIHRATGWIGIVCSGPGEEGLGDLLVRCSDAPLENLSGRTSLPGLVSVVAGAHLLIANDTSAIHIAAAVSTPSVCILGGGHHGRFVPYRTEVKTDRPLPVAVSYRMECFHCNWICIYHPKPAEPAPCVANISVDAAWDAVRKLLPEPT